MTVFLSATADFRHYASDAHLMGLNVGVYGTGDERRLVAENVAANSKSRYISAWKTVTADEYAELRCEWEAGCLSGQDARITERALAFMGVGANA